ncbi:cytochrome P450 1A1-like [Mercenaria mercenaria]|uniref:cytochrome P450 1A1-like n=1 Tax=Mercenaria mercenaria TaxID=6596 RepID=UPI00234E48E5|nr:cytochrome P450 1A1-like [Mercenaria mercenaria]
MLDITNFVSLLIALLTMFWIAMRAKIFSKKRYPPGPWGIPLLGHLHLLGDNPERKYLQWWQRYGDVVKIRFGSWNAIVVNGYDTIKDVAERKDDVFSGRPNFVTQVVLREAFGGIEALTFVNFSPKYLQLRKRTATALRSYLSKCEYCPEDLFREEAEKLTEKLLRYPSDDAVSVVSDVELAVVSVLYQMLYGKGKESEIAPHLNSIVETTATFNKFVGSGNIFDVIPWLQYVMKGKVEQFKEAVLSTDWITKAKIEEHRLSFQKGQTRDVLDALCDLSADLPSCESVDSVSSLHLMYQVAALQGAGFDTTSRTILFIILYLIAYPDVQERVQKEVDDVLGSSKIVKWKDRDTLPYLNATIYEVMRKTTVVPFAIPHYTLNDTELRGYDIDKDTVVFLNLHSVANEKSFWGDPENFRPERLLDEDGMLDAEKCSHIMTFSAGRRRCVGDVIAKMNIFILITTLMQRCSFKKADGHDVDFEPVRSLVLSPKPFMVNVNRRY